MALAEAAPSVTVDCVTDGDAALAYVHRQGPFAGRPELDLVLLDLRLPTVDGFKVLNEMKSHDHLKNMPVVILSTSSCDTDVQRAKAAGASAFVVKPATYDEWCDMARSLVEKWCVEV